MQQKAIISLRRSVKGFAAVAVGTLLCAAAPSRADSVNLGPASGFSVLGYNSLQDDFSLVTVTGNVGVANTSNLHVMAPSKVIGTVFVGPSATFSDDKSPSQNITGGVTTGADLSGAVSTITNTFNTYTALMPTQTFSGIGSATTITGNGGTNVIDINGNISKSITLSGGPNDLFVLNVNGSINLGGSDAIGGVSPSQILINVEGSGSVNTHVGNVINGTVIDPGGSGNLDGAFNGHLFFGGSSLTLLSGATVQSPPTTVPLPRSLWASFVLLGGLALRQMFVRRETTIA